ncbi:MAG: FAD-binding protein, partial [Nocardiopsaceae bacterium]|nr:FAD-binding protein [Nocardiopsaceae bacterium]
AAAIGPGDTAAAHARDTEVAGAGLCEPDVVAALAAGSPGAVEWLVAAGAELERRNLRVEGGHGAHRVVHSGNDATGAEVHRALREALLTSGIEILDRTIALDLLTDDSVTSDLDAGRGGVRGVAAAGIGPGGVLSPGLITARAVILAAGGLGQAYATTSNPSGATGDALAIAARAGAVLRDPEFVQFHPTVLYLPGISGQRPLITEALRGAGAVLRDLDGRPLMAGHDPRGDLAPRDIVAARVHSMITSASDGPASSGGEPGHVWLDATALGADVLENGFPTVTAACRKHDIDPVTDLIPVAPGAHYSCGGILAGLDGRTSIPGLHAIGEAASTGFHGANRLASNSLVEAVISGRRAGYAAYHQISGTAAGGERGPAGASADHRLPNGFDVTPTPFYGDGCHIDLLWGELAAGRGELEMGRGEPGGGTAAESRAALASAMSRYAGVLRDAPGLERLLRIIASAPRSERVPGARGEPSPNGWMRQRPPKSGVDAAATSFGSGVDAAATPFGSGADFARGADAAARSFGLAEFGLAEVEAANLREVSALIAAAALHRSESRGAHRRSDAPDTAPIARHTLVRYHR